MKKNNFRGVSLVEIMFVAAILGIVTGLGAMGVRALNSIMRENASSQMELEAQSILYQMTREIRNANAILEISTGTPNLLSMKSFNTRLGYDVLTSPIFNPVFIGTITYQFVQTPTESYLLKTISTNTFDGAGNVTGASVYSRKLLQNILQPDDPQTPVVDPIFEAVVFNDRTTPIQIVLRLGKGYFRDSPKIYKAQAMVHSTGQL
jgi:type II secretory pathway pseudopilin PulG